MALNPAIIPQTVELATAAYQAAKPYVAPVVDGLVSKLGSDDPKDEDKVVDSVSKVTKGAVRDKQTLIRYAGSGRKGAAVVLSSIAAAGVDPRSIVDANRLTDPTVRKAFDLAVGRFDQLMARVTPKEPAFTKANMTPSIIAGIEVLRYWERRYGNLQAVIEFKGNLQALGAMTFDEIANYRAIMEAVE